MTLVNDVIVILLTMPNYEIVENSVIYLKISISKFEQYFLLLI